MSDSFDIGSPIRDCDVGDFNIGDIFYECEMGMNIEAKVTSIPELEVDGDGRKSWSWMAENTQNGDEISYRLTEGLSHYGPRLYTKPQYIHVSEGKKRSFKLVGAPDE